MRIHAAVHVAEAEAGKVPPAMLVTLCIVFTTIGAARCCHEAPRQILAPTASPALRPPSPSSIHPPSHKLSPSLFSTAADHCRHHQHRPTARLQLPRVLGSPPEPPPPRPWPPWRPPPRWPRPSPPGGAGRGQGWRCYRRAGARSCGARSKATSPTWASTVRSGTLLALLFLGRCELRVGS